MLSDQRVGCQIGVRHQRADPHTTLYVTLYLVERQPADVHDPVGRGHPQPHPVDEVGAAGEEHGTGARCRGDRARGVVGAPVVEGLHCCATARTDAIRRHLWNGRFFADYDLDAGAANGRLTAATVFPLFARVALRPVMVPTTVTDSCSPSAEKLGRARRSS